MAFCYIQANDSGVILQSYFGGQVFSAPWIPVTAEQHAQIQPGSLWVDGAVQPPPPPPPPSFARQAASFVASGISITSTSMPSLNGVYSVSPAGSYGQQAIGSEAQFISTFGEFTNGSSASLDWPLKSGAMVTFTATGQFLAFAKAAAQFVSAVQTAVTASAAGVTGVTLPSSAYTIP